MTPSPPRARGLFRALGVVLFLAFGTGFFFLLTPTGRGILFGARVRQATTDRAVAPGVLVALFGEALKQGLAPAGIDTSLLRAESIVGAQGTGGATGRHRYRWDVPLPRGVMADSASAFFRAALARFEGKPSPAEAEGAPPGLRSGRLRDDIRVEVLFLEADDRQDGHPRLAILITEFGYLNGVVESEELLSFARDVTVAISPYGTGARSWADRARQKGLEVVIDLPMEGLDYPKRDPGKEAILVDLSEREIRKRLEKAFNQLGGADGVHTVQGALAVEDRIVMRTVLTEIHRRKAYFLDSAKTTFSAVPALAAELAMPARRIRAGLDCPKCTSAQIEARLEDLATSAREQGVAVGVLRPYPGTVAALRKLLPTWAASGLEVVPLSEVVTVPKVASISPR